MATANRPRPGRSLAIVAVALVGLYLALFLGPAQTPALGLDLRGGTEVTLKAQPIVKGGKIDKAALDQAVNIIRDRTNGLGVGGAEISTQGTTNITVAVPGKGRDQVVKTLGSTALLRFRQVYMGRSPLSSLPSATQPASPGATPTTAPKPTPKASHSTATTRKKKSHGDALSSVLTAGTTAHAKAKPGKAGKAPKVTKTPSTGPTPSATAAAPTPSSTASAPPATSNTAPVAEAASITPGLLAEYNKVDCTNSKANNPTQGLDDANDYIVSCGTVNDGYPAYILGPAKLLGTDVKSADASLPSTGGLDWQVNLTFTGSGGNKWFDLTKTAYESPAVGADGSCTSACNSVAIVLDGITQSAPASQSDGIPGGSAEITGSFTQSQADDLAEVLKYGALPLKFTEPSVESVSATLGASELRGGLVAGVIGLGLVILFSLLYYRALGIVTIGSLAVSGLLLYAVTTLLGHSSVGYTLSLPGIAGFIVAVGITADSFVVFFERLRDEIRDGRRLRSGVERAWPRARRTIISADFVSLLAAFVLYIVSIGDVRGFAFTLGLSTISDLFIVFLFTKPLLTLLANVKAFDSGKPWTGVGKSRAGTVREPEAVRRRKAREAT